MMNDRKIKRQAFVVDKVGAMGTDGTRDWHVIMPDGWRGWVGPAAFGCDSQPDPDCDKGDWRHAEDAWWWANR